MSTVKDTIPRSTMTTAQQRHIGALQAAKAVLLGGTYNALSPDQVFQVLRLAEFIVDER